MSPQSNNNKRTAKNTLLPNALFDGGVAVHELSGVEYVRIAYGKYTIFFLL